RIADGDATALNQIGVQTPQGFNPQGREWGLARRSSDGAFLVIQGETGGVKWVDLMKQGFEPLDHTHPMWEGRAMAKPGATVGELLADPGINMDRIHVMPSIEDLQFCSTNALAAHEVHTPYVHMGGGRIGNPVAGGTAPTVSFRILNAEIVGWADIYLVTRCRVEAVAGGQVVWQGQVYGWGGGIPFMGTAPPPHLSTTRPTQGAYLPNKCRHVAGLNENRPQQPGGGGP
ncbi:MAG: hypothetical protein AB1416_12440, partial [Actinomycetota bacterium]